MGIELYAHNQEAYRAVRKMMAGKGLAAVVHPTETGKSYIAFKLCEDEPDKTVKQIDCHQHTLPGQQQRYF